MLVWYCTKNYRTKCYTRSEAATCWVQVWHWLCFSCDVNEVNEDSQGSLFETAHCVKMLIVPAQCNTWTNIIYLFSISVGRPSKRKRSPRRDSPKRGFRTRRVSLPMQQHPGFEPCVLAKAKVWLPVDVIEEVSFVTHILYEITNARFVFFCYYM